ncbi:hypothetical protein D3C87_1919520 [compost metagenome]
MLGDQAHFTVITWNEKHIGIHSANLSELSFKVHVPRHVTKVCDNVATAFFKFLNKHIRKTHAVVILHITQNRCSFGLEVFGSKFSHNQTLKGINKANAENIISYFGDSRIC